MVGDVLGAGIYALVGEVGGRVGGAIWTAFLLALVLALFTACAYAELVTKYPQAAGAALYVNRAFGKPVRDLHGRLRGDVRPGSRRRRRSRAAFGGDYLSEFVEMPTVLVGARVPRVVALDQLPRHRREREAQRRASRSIELAGLLLVIVIGVAALARRRRRPGARAGVQGGRGAVARPILGGAGLAFYALIGFEDSVNVAEEARDPQRDFPRALFGGLLIAGASTSLVTRRRVDGRPDRHAGRRPTGRCSRSSTPARWRSPTKLFAAIALFALANGALINMIMASRLLYGMARGGHRPAASSAGAARAAGRRRGWRSSFTTRSRCVLLAPATSRRSPTRRCCCCSSCSRWSTWRASSCAATRSTTTTSARRPSSRSIGVGVCVALMTQKSGETYARAGALLALGVAFWLVNRLVTGPRGPFATRELEVVEGR